MSVRQQEATSKDSRTRQEARQGTFGTRAQEARQGQQQQDAEHKTQDGRYL
ncbi:hypothetical protein [Alkalimonas amylolytica]|uniref:Uncharacterized protein n=1 Tax=Alkalimonas amylolytica TaxID=152573 RepID=A0A1H4E591_ALKAM|nr:hypothetical protein [Alkalimonas amylolytica]SEA79959.1 hypothetical protein SAMN04488051_106215 [Alkalimonas amylolytica]